MDEALTIEVRHEQGCAIVTVAGEIDISTVTPLRDRLFEVAASGASRWWSIWTRLALSIPSGSPRWSARPSAQPRTAAPCRWSAPGRRSGPWCDLPGCTAGYRCSTPWTRPWRSGRPVRRTRLSSGSAVAAHLVRTRGGTPSHPPGVGWRATSSALSPLSGCSTIAKGSGRRNDTWRSRANSGPGRPTNCRHRRPGGEAPDGCRPHLRRLPTARTEHNVPLVVRASRQAFCRPGD